LLGSCLWPTISESIPSRNKSNLKREPGAIYLEDFSEDKVELLAIKQEPIYVSPQRKKAIGQLRKGKKVTLIAMINKQYLIRGMALHGQVKGWIFPSALQGLNKDFSDKLHALYERKKVVDELIKNKQIALGMNTGEVVESMGKPSRKNSKLDRGGRLDTYEYSTFERVAQYRFRRDSQGNLFRQKYYVKMETGKLSVIFKNDIVESIEETEGNPLGGGDLKIVPIPIELF
tara:strand:- start:697 stop:1389 length:693 start_codon:yes stop_codon:yes gene_type:complete